MYKLSVPIHHYFTVRASKRACADLRTGAHQCLMLVELLSYDTKEPSDSCFTLYLYCGVFHYFYQLFFFFLFLQVWSTSTCEFVRTLNGHKRGIACLQYRDRLVVSGSSDNTIR